MSRRRKWIFIAALLIAPVAALLGYRSIGWTQYDGSLSPVAVDLSHPDALIRTQSLSSLPGDLLQVPLAQDLLTEDFVFYYEEHPDRLGFKGSLRRIAYEHELQWTDEIVSWILDQPAEVRLWRGPKGALDYWVLSLSRSELTKVLQEAATLAMKDRQLKLAGQLTADGAALPVYSLEYGPRRTLLFVSKDDRVLVLSHPGILLDSEGTPIVERETALARLLSAAETPAAEGDPMLRASEAKHSVTVRMHYLSFGYQRFFRGLEALRFDFGKGQWSTEALIDGAALPPAALDDRALWAGVPAHPALCALLPVDWKQGRPLAEGIPAEGDQAPADLVDRLSGPAAVCWYANGRVHSPLFVATVHEGTGDLAPLFEAAFEWTVAPGGGGERLQAKRPRAGTHVWERVVTAPYVKADDDGRAQPGPVTVTLATHGRYAFFSPDGALVEQALATVQKRYPSLGETLSGAGPTLGVIVPKAMGEIGGKEALVMLPRASEPVFRAAVESRLLPRLQALAKYPGYRLALADAAVSARQWVPVAWQELAR